MQTSKQISYYRWVAAALGFAILFTTALSSLGIVWMRQNISKVAQNKSQIEKSIAEIDRKNRDLAAMIAKVHSPVYLISRMPKGLRPTAEQQVVWMEQPSFQVSTEMIAHQEETPLTVSFDLAFMDIHRRGRSE